MDEEKERVTKKLVGKVILSAKEPVRAMIVAERELVRRNTFLRVNFSERKLMRSWVFWMG